MNPQDVIESSAVFVSLLELSFYLVCLLKYLTAAKGKGWANIELLEFLAPGVETVSGPYLTKLVQPGEPCPDT